ncbi:MAG TPA: thiol:disulfide interchange protein DsbA/DsbL [Burkholderiales bacterium]|nr:thiol:disulfide interchange protein DsbA/DsbL [Burkholderiales bacterium]
MILAGAARRAAQAALACLLLLQPAVRAADEAPRIRANVDYRLIEPQPVTTGSRVEVIDFFWYGCPHCYTFQPALESWIRRMPADVALRRVPALLRDNWAPHARIYYTLEALGEVERLHQAVYHGYHVEELHMSKPDVMLQWAMRQGIDGRRWTEAYHSAKVTEKVERAKEMTNDYNVQGTPSLVVDGRYLTSPAMARGEHRMIPILEELIALARAERSRK